MYCLPRALWYEVGFYDLGLYWVIHEKLTVVHLVTKYPQIHERPPLDPVSKVVAVYALKRKWRYGAVVINNGTRWR